MILTNKITKAAVSFIRENSSTSEEDLEKIDYGLKVIVSNFFKFVLLFVTAYFLGIVKYTALALAIFGAVRTFACGAHASSTLQCIILNFLLFFGNVCMSLYHPLSKTGIITLLLISIFLLCLYAPADTAERPLVSRHLRKLLKIASIFISLLLFILCFFINNPIYKTIITYSVFQESLAITPLFYKILGKPYRNYVNVTL